MNGGASQFARVLATLTPITTRCVTPDFDAIQTCSDEEWEALMTARYGADFETRDFDQPSTHRSDCLARYGEDIFGDGK